MLPLLSLHALAAQRGDGLRPELKALFERRARLETGLAAIIEPLEQASLPKVKDVPVKPGIDEPAACVSSSREDGQ